MDIQGIALLKTQNLQKELKSPHKNDRSVIEAQLRTELAEYFISDKQDRLQELDEIKERECVQQVSTTFTF